VKQSNLCQYFAGWSIKIILTSATFIRPFASKPVMDIAFGIGIFIGYKGLKWIRDFVYHLDNVFGITASQGQIIDSGKS
jgi:hypothetical protein